MSQHDMIIDNSTGANVRADINNALGAIATNNSGSSAPSNTQPTQFFADTSAGILKLRNTANSGYVNLFTLAGGVDVDAASNFNEDVTFTGATSGRNIVFDKSDNALEFLDNSVCKFGTDGDGDIFHDGSDLFIRETDSGQLLFRADGQLVFANSSGSEVRLLSQNNGKVDLYFDNVVRLGTTSTGVSVVGTLSSTSHFQVGDNVQIQMGNAGTNDFILVHDGTDNIINCGNNGNLFQRAASIHLQSLLAEDKLIADTDGEVKLFHDGSQKFATKSYGAAVTGNFVTTGAITIESGNDLFLADSGKIQLGTGNDFEVYHNGTDGIIDNNTGNLSIQTTANLELVIQSIFQAKTKGGTENCIIGNTDGAVELYFDNSRKFFTHSAGATLESTNNTPTFVFRGAAGLDMGNIAVDQFVSNNSLMKFSTLSSGTQSEVCRLLDNGQILIGKTTNAFATGAGLVISANGNVHYSATGSAAHDFAEFHRGTNGSMTRIGFIRTDGSSTTYSTTSDYRLKENVTAISDGITRLKTLKPYRFNFKTDTSKVVDGFFAHEVTAVPEAVSGIKDEVDSDNNPVYQGIDQSKLVPLLVAAVQELITKVETLEAA